ncbi:response regulator [Desulfatibacillum aliphaticivorans]|uniref:Response regulator receiver domain protein (CheY-like) n=1 Tax=Desulfatibacillum aliphaticivorans TaxID=218208 RepID=B8F8Y3_DESAL|nr:response regulator [Desulfatibacillum aliphaticivorans]ACL02015.1 Response regulator receiver domain protein (CheY-like) [Desulfatibacillum aliphaticivorans]
MARILVVDDDVNITSMLRRLFQRRGYDVDEAINGKQALQVMDQNLPDLVITDIIMPEMEGAELIMEIRKRAPGVKIIAISGGGRIQPADYLDLAEKLGAECSFAKPVKQSDMLAAVERLLETG